MRTKHPEDGFSHSMTDLMAGVAVTFLLLAAVFMIRADRLKQAAEAEKNKFKREAQEVRAQEPAKKELEKLKADLASIAGAKSDDVRIEVDPKDPLVLLVVFTSQDWFAAGDCRPSRDARERIKPLLASVFRKVCSKELTFVDSIVLEGHSDRKPLRPGGLERCGSVESCVGDRACETAGFNNNVRLSAARAQEVYFLARQGMALQSEDQRVVAECLEPRVVVSGRGPVEPRDGSDWHQSSSDGQLAADRRVVLKVRFQQRAYLDGALARNP